MGWLALGGALLAVLALAGRAFVNADPAKLVRALAWSAGILGVLLIVLLAASGRLGWILMALPLALPLLLRGRAAWNRAKVYRRMADAAGGGSGAAPGQRSELDTRTLHMTLDHASGTMAGRVRHGPFAGRDLDGMSLEETLDLFAWCRVEDPDSARVLETYLDRRFGDSWHAAAEGHASAAGSATDGAMSVEEAARVLGVAPDADREAVRAAHHRLIAAVHPDHGGSDFLAAKINQAKDVLLKAR